MTFTLLDPSPDDDDGTDTIATRVQAGIAFLDRMSYETRLLEDSPLHNWDSRIDLDTLFMLSYERCILGQLFGDSYRGCMRLKMSREEGEGYGFYAYAEEEDAYEGEYAALTVEWKKAITARREGVR